MLGRIDRPSGIYEGIRIAERSEKKKQSCETASKIGAGRFREMK